MVEIILTKSGGLLGPIVTVFGWIMNAIYNFFSLFGVHNIALTIIVFTFITRALMLPLTIKQQKFTKLSSKMNPELQKVQAKYKGKKDEASLRKMQEENNAIYQKYGASPMAGCLPLLITLPIMFALYRVIYNIPAYVDKVYDLYAGIAQQVQGVNNHSDLMATIIANVKSYKGSKTLTLTDLNSIIDVLRQFTGAAWDAFESSFSGILNANALTLKNGETLTVIETIGEIKKVNGFFGLNIANSPGYGFPGILIPILAGVLQFIQGKQLQVKNKDDNKDNPAASAMNSMNIVMPIMTIFFCVAFPIGIGIYWIASSVFAIVQQFFVNRYLDKIDVDDLIKKNLAKAGKRNAYLESKGISMADLARKQTKNIENTAVKRENNTVESGETSKTETDSDKSSQSSNGARSISEIANILKNRNEKGDK